jgi:hypothetical protein
LGIDKSQAGVLFVPAVFFLILILAFFPEIQGLFNVHVSSSIYKREVFLIELLFVIFVIFNKHIKYPEITTAPRVVVVAFSLWVVSSAVSALLSVIGSLSILTYAEHLTHLLFALSVYSFVRKHMFLYKYALIVPVLGFAAYCIFFLFSYLLDSDLSSPGSGRYIFPTSLTEVGFRHIRHFGYYLSIIVVAALGVVHQCQYNFRRPLVLLGLLALTLSWMFMAWIGGRGPFFAIALSLLVVAFLFRINEYKALLFTAGVTFIIGTGLSFYLPDTGFGIGYMLQRWFSLRLGFDVEGLNAFSSSRLMIWKECLSDIAENPYFGVGQNGFLSTCRLRISPAITQPHGFHIQSLLDWGVFGSLFFLTALISLLYYAYKKNNSQYAELSTTRLFVFWSVIMLLVYSSIDGIMFQRYTLAFFAFYMGLLQIDIPKPEYADEMVQTSLGSFPYRILLYIILGIIGYHLIIEVPIIPGYL